MLSKDCYKCPNRIRKQCEIRFVTVKKGEFVYCADGSRHLVELNGDWIK